MNGLRNGNQRRSLATQAHVAHKSIGVNDGYGDIFITTMQ